MTHVLLMLHAVANAAEQAEAACSGVCSNHAHDVLCPGVRCAITAEYAPGKALV
jgi:hypothetical protein